MLCRSSFVFDTGFMRNFAKVSVVNKRPNVIINNEIFLKFIVSFPFFIYKKYEYAFLYKNHLSFQMQIFTFFRHKRQQYFDVLYQNT